jgi:hypothetical protein
MVMFFVLHGQIVISKCKQHLGLLTFRWIIETAPIKRTSYISTQPVASVVTQVDAISEPKNSDATENQDLVSKTCCGWIQLIKI